MNNLLPHILVLTTLLIITNTYCNTICTYKFDGSTYSDACTLSFPHLCTSCDTQLYYHDSIMNNCVLRTDGIYNATGTININADGLGWTCNNTDCQSANMNGGQYYRLKQNTKVYKQRTLAVGAYGIKVRLSLYDNSADANVNLSLVINNTGEYPIAALPTVNLDYNLQQWIYTSPYIPYTDDLLIITIKRTDTTLYDGTFGTGSISVGFRDVIILVAQCVPGCTSCTSLKDCSTCSAGYYFDNKTKMCSLAACPNGTFISSNTANYCDPCDPKCLICDTISTTCTLCTQSGVNQAFYYDTQCYQDCPNSFHQNYTTHICQCFDGNYQTITNICQPCNIACLSCTGNNANQCSRCAFGYYLINETTQCVAQCPSDHYPVYSSINSNLCLLCDPSCTTCITDRITCTSCFNTYLTQLYICVVNCPPGYAQDKNTWSCIACQIQRYSLNGICYKTCPNPYIQSDIYRACILPTFQVSLSIATISANTLAITIYFLDQLSAVSISLLQLVNWSDYLTIDLLHQSSSENISQLILKPRLLQLQAQQQQFNQLSQSYQTKRLTFDNIQILPTSIILTTTSISPYQLTSTTYFQLNFPIQQLTTPLNAYYQFSSVLTTDQQPWFIRQYYQYNLIPLFIIGIFLTTIPLILLLINIKNTYRILIEYIHCLQLIGLTIFAIYPHTSSLYLYSFLLGIDYSNFSFMYNIPRQLVTPCSDCTSLTSYAFVMNDMNYLRIMGSILLSLLILLIIWVILYIIKCSRRYSYYYMKLILDMMLIKIVHGWFSSLLFAGLNYAYNYGDVDYFQYGMHILGYLLLLPLVYWYWLLWRMNNNDSNGKDNSCCCYKNNINSNINNNNNNNNNINVSRLFLILYVILLVLISLAPMIISFIIIFISWIQWILKIYINNNTYNNNINNNNKKIIKQQQDKQQQQQHKQIKNTINDNNNNNNNIKQQHKVQANIQNIQNNIVNLTKYYIDHDYAINDNDVDNTNNYQLEISQKISIDNNNNNNKNIQNNNINNNNMQQTIIIQQQQQNNIHSNIHNSRTIILLYNYHTYLLYCMKPITMFLIATIIMLTNTITTIIIVSCVMGIILIVIGVYLCLLLYCYQYNNNNNINNVNNNDNVNNNKGKLLQQLQQQLVIYHYYENNSNNNNDNYMMKVAHQSNEHNHHHRNNNNINNNDSNIDDNLDGYKNNNNNSNNNNNNNNNNNKMSSSNYKMSKKNMIKQIYSNSNRNNSITSIPKLNNNDDNNYNNYKNNQYRRSKTNKIRNNNNNEIRNNNDNSYNNLNLNLTNQDLKQDIQSYNNNSNQYNLADLSYNYDGNEQQDDAVNMKFKSKTVRTNMKDQKRKNNKKNIYNY